MIRKSDLWHIIRKSEVKKTEITKWWRKYTITGTLKYSTWKHNFFNHLWKEFDIIYQCWRRSLYPWPRNPTPKHKPKEQRACLHQRVYTGLSTNIISNGSKMKTTEMLITIEWVNSDHRTAHNTEMYVSVLLLHAIAKIKLTKLWVKENRHKRMHVHVYGVQK